MHNWIIAWILPAGVWLGTRMSVYSSSTSFSYSSLPSFPKAVTWSLGASSSCFPKRAVWEHCGAVAARKQMMGARPTQGRADGEQEDRGALPFDNL